MVKVKELFTNWRVVLMTVAVVFAIIAIHPVPWREGVALRSVVSNSSASDAGFLSPKPTITPTARERILSFDGMPISSIADYEAAIANLKPNQSVTIETTNEFYSLKTRFKSIKVNATVNVTREVSSERRINGSFTNITINRTSQEVQEVSQFIKDLEDIGLKVYSAPTSNLRKGLDLQGGTRVILQPAEEVSAQDMDTLLESLKQRLNVFGLSDIVVRSAIDLAGDQFIIVEIAGASEEDVRELLAKQGKFEAKIGNTTVFRGGQDVKYVCRTADCSGIDARQGGCGQSSGGYACRFSFAISLSPDAARRQADATRDLRVVSDQSGRYLNEPLVLYLDDKEVDRLNIADDLRGRPVTDISISGSGVGASQQAAVTDALEGMKRLQTVLITGSLPVKLEIVDLETISPMLGETFVQHAILAGLLSLLAVGTVIFIRYRLLAVAVPIMITCLAEVLLVIGFAALSGWNLDLAAIAGIIIAIGTGVDHQIVISDETLRKVGEGQIVDWKQRFKNAMFIIMAVFFTTGTSMVVLYFAGAGLLKGFALTTLAGLALGVFITRPAFGAMLQILLRD
ncbi:hypothetical protein HY641_00640 [Candidatus Woesearchaeota archaeon]|nr:hypothetical protein [Candidatus Woesearchaeota archaeon]